MFYGKMRQRLELSDPTAPEPVRVQEEPFFSLLVDVAEEGRTVYDGLDNVFDDSLVTVSSTEARRTVALIGVPPILQIQLQRVQYDRIEKKIFKSNAYMQFGETISMDRYLEVDPNDVEAVARRDRTNELKRQMEKARARLAELTRSKVSSSTRSPFSDRTDARWLADARRACKGISHDVRAPREPSRPRRDAQLRARGGYYRRSEGLRGGNRQPQSDHRCISRLDRGGLECAPGCRLPALGSLHPSRNGVEWALLHLSEGQQAT
jgi:hypothetical protein